jgi:hypothetical protein
VKVVQFAILIPVAHVAMRLINDFSSFAPNAGDLPVITDQLSIYWKEKDEDSEWVRTETLSYIFHVSIICCTIILLVYFCFVGCFVDFKKLSLSSNWRKKKELILLFLKYSIFYVLGLIIKLQRTEQQIAIDKPIICQFQIRLM